MSVTLTPDNSQSPLTETPSRRDLEFQVTQLQALVRKAETERDRVKQELAKHLHPGDTLRPKATTATGQVKLGTISYSDPQPTVRVSDLDELIGWANEFYPTGVKRVEAVIIPAHDELHEAFLNLFTVENGQVKGPGGETDIPGLAVRPGRPPSISVTADDAGVTALWRDQSRRLELMRQVVQDDDPTVIDGQVG